MIGLRFRFGLSARAFAFGVLLAAGIADPAPAQSRIVIAADTAPEAAAYEPIVADAITVVLQRQGFDLVGADQPADQPGGTSEASTQLALRWEYAILSILPRLHLSVSVYDEARGVMVATRAGRARANVTLFNSVDELVYGAIAEVETYRTVVEAESEFISPIPIVARLRPPSPRVPGEEIIVQPDAPFEMSNGEAVLLARGVSVPIAVMRRGHHVAVGTASTAGDGQPGESSVLRTVPRELPDPEPLRRVGLQLHYSAARTAGGGGGVRYGFIPDRFHMAGEFDVYLSGALDGAPNQVLHLESRLLAEVTALRLRRMPFSLHLSSGPGIVGTFFLNGLVAPYTDLYWNIANAAIVLRTGRQEWFVRSGVKYTFETERGYFAEGLGESTSSPELFFGTVRRW